MLLRPVTICSPINTPRFGSSTPMGASISSMNTDVNYLDAKACLQAQLRTNENILARERSRALTPIKAVSMDQFIMSSPTSQRS